MAAKQKNPLAVYSFLPREDDKVYAVSTRELLHMHGLPEAARAVSRLLILFFLLMVTVLITIPWQQTSQGSGRVIAYLPQERVQNVHAPVSGRINKWFVRE